MNQYPRKRGNHGIFHPGQKRNAKPDTYEKTGVKQPLPDILKVTFNAYHRGRTVDARAVLQEGAGYGNPPHVIDSVRLSVGGVFTSHPRVSLCDFAYRDVEWLKRKKHAVSAEKRLAYKALIYCGKRGRFPDWDPYHRTPVDFITKGKDDLW